MDNAFRMIRALPVIAIAIIFNHSVVGQSPCGEPIGISHGHSVVLRRGKLAQYFCDQNYFLHGQAMVSCLNGDWNGIPPKCITFTCRPIIHPMHSDRQEIFRGSLITYTCRDGFILDGSAEIYCDGQRWSSSPPECREDLEATLLAPASPEVVIENAPVDSLQSSDVVLGNTSAVSSHEASVGSGDAFRPRYVSHSEQPPRLTNYAKLARNGVISLFKPANADSDDSEPTNDETRQRELHMPPIYQSNNNPSPGIERPISPMIMRPSFPRFVPASQNIPTDRRFDWRYNARTLTFYPPRPPYLPPYIRGPVYPKPPVLQPIFQQGQYGDTADQRIVTNRGKLPVGPSSPDEVPPRDNRWDAAIKPTESQLMRPNTITGIEPTPPAKIQLPPLTTQKQENVARSCSTPLRPGRGYYQIRSLPRDYEGDALYLAEYHCQTGLTLVGGDNLSYCMKTGRWKGRLPRCEKNVKCDAGYIKEGDACVDLNECADNNGGCTQTCHNFQGGYRCSCLPGYKNHRTNECADIDECEEDRCQHNCRNIPGSFECSCNHGYAVSKTDLKKCVDKNECATPGHRPCDHLCQNTMGSFRCACKPNFRLGEDGRTCFEVCMPGYTMKMDDTTHKRACVDEDECEEHNGLGNCEHICNNTAGSYFCTCNVGHQLNPDGQSCSDINECEESSPCDYECVNTVGSYRCNCLPDQVSSADGLSCLGCTKNYYLLNGRCSACPENSVTEGNGATAVRHCECIPGYEGSPLLRIPCTDVDECSDDNYGCSHQCVNTPGSVHCDCPDGHLLDIDGRTCTDRDECISQPGLCGDGHQCRNTEGGYMCVCMRGFQNSRVNPRKCVDIDECSVRNGGCQSRCHNMQPGHRCSCYGGKTLARDGRTCIHTGNTCTPLHTIPNGRVLPTSVCSDVPNVTFGQVCFYSCNGGYKMRGSYRTRCGERGWSNSPPKCVGTGKTCPPIRTIAYGKALPASPCSSNSTVSMGRTCFFVCERGYTLQGVRQVTCGESGWSSIPPKCIASDSCQAQPVPEGVHVTPSTCATINTLPWATCLFSCKIPNDILNGSRTATCFPGNRWQHEPPICISRLPSINGDLDVPWIQCPANMSVRLSAGRSRAFIQGLRPVTNMNETVHVRSDGVQSIDSFPVGKTTVKFIARSGEQMASCETVILVQDRQAPVIISCPGTINIMTSNRYPGRVWKHPLFRDNVDITKVTRSILPPGKITWGKYRVTYVASDAAGNTAECAFTVILKRSMPRNQIQVLCGTPSGPDNGSPNCEAWARGVYCNPTCMPGYAFAQTPPAYVCGEDGVWTPENTIPNCMDMRTNEMRMHHSEITPPTTETPRRGNVPDVTSTRQTTAAQIEESRSQNTSPVLKILKKPKFHSIPISQPERSRLRPTFIQSQNVISPEVTQSRPSLQPHNTTDCPQGQIPKLIATGSLICVECPKGHYRPRIKIAELCRPCSPGFYQERSGQSYCSRCRNVPIRYLPVLRYRVEFRGLASSEQCPLVGAYISRIAGDSSRSSDTQRNSNRRSRRHHQFMRQ